jgi:mono/diheme cytochrome c family protein
LTASVPGGKRIGSIVATVLAAALPPSPGTTQPPSLSTWSGVYSQAQAQRGREVYLATCSQCHAPDMTGIDSAPPLTGGRFAANWNGVALADMLERIRVSMPQNNPGTLSRALIADVTAYVLQQNGFPAGESELPRQAALLKTIAYEAYGSGGQSRD